MQLLRSILGRSLSKSFVDAKISCIRAFTLVELIVTVSIFAFTTALVISKYGNFNQNVLLTNLAYDIALTIRTAQTFGVSVKTADDVSNPCNQSNTPFQCVYGVHFNPASNSTFVLYAVPIQTGGSYHYPGSANNINEYTIKNGGVINNIYTCTTSNNLVSPGNDPTDCTAMNSLVNVDIYFKRPDSSSHICTFAPSSGVENCTWSSAYIKITSGNGSTNYRLVAVYQNGQISVND